MAEAHRPADPSHAYFETFDYPAIARELRDHPAYQKNSKNSRALLHSPGLSQVLVAFAPGGAMKEHHAPSPAFALVLEGEVLFRSELPGKEGEPPHEVRLTQGCSAAFSPNLPHSVEAVGEALMLLTIGGGS